MTHSRINELTLNEKASLTSGASFWTTRGIDRLGIEGATLSDGPHGVRFQRAGADHLGINESVPATAMPTGSTLGSTWSPATAAEVGAALAVEARHFGVDILLGPGINMKRSPLCGRNFEYLAEDPLLAGALGAAWTHGVQDRGVGVSVKHFAVNNQETDRMRVSADVDERTLREIYLPAFERVVTGEQPATVMCSYNRINGTPASENHRLLTEILRDEWGFDGYVVSDWGAVSDPVAAVAAGTDLAMPATGTHHAERIEAAILDGSLSQDALDVAVSRQLGVHERLRASRTPVADVDWDAHHALARRVAAEGAVLLTNDNDLLPLDPRSGGSIAVVGEFARTPRYQGAGSSHINPTRLDDAITAIRNTTDREVLFAPGFTLDGSADDGLLDSGVDAARRAEVVVLFLGLPDDAESEGFDRTHLNLPDNQLTLLAALRSVNPNIVVVLSNGGVVSLEGIAGVVPAILEMWLAGQASGSAAADIIFGLVEPAGRLAETIPIRLADTPAFLNWPGANQHVLYGERHYIGYRWYDAAQKDVAFPFGHGLGYTTFEYSDLSVSVPDPSVPEAIVEISVTNTGLRSGSEVVQIYVADPVSRLDRPVRELRAFEKVTLRPGETRRVRTVLERRAFAFWDAAGWVVEPGEFVLEVGASSRDIRHRASLTLTVPAPEYGLDLSSSWKEWWEDAAGAAVLSAFLDRLGDAAALLRDPSTIKLVKSMPLANIISAAGLDGQSTVDVLLEDVHRARSETPVRS